MTNSPIKIAYVITRAEMGGAQVHVLDLLRGFAERHIPILITGERGYLTEECERLGIEYHVVPTLTQPLRPIKDLRAAVDITRLMRRIKPDLVHCHTSKAGVLGRLAGRLCGIPTIFTAHTWCFAEGTSVLWRIVGKPAERISAYWTEKIIAVSDSNRRLAIDLKVVRPEKIITIHNGISDTPYVASHPEGETPRIIMVARFAPQKNQAELVEALKDIKAPFQLEFVGDGPTRPAVEALIKTYGLGDRIRILGVRKDTDQLLGAANLFVLATKWEGFPITILEAMRACLPVIATDVNGVREAVVDAETGLLYGRSQVDKLRAALESLITDPQKRAALGQAGRKRYEQNFTCDVMLARTESIYREALASRVARNGVYRSNLAPPLGNDGERAQD